MVVAPSERLRRLLAGQVHIDDEDESIQSWASFEIYRGACAILNRKTKEERQKALSRIPNSIRPRVEAEIMRVWNYRKGVS